MILVTGGTGRVGSQVIKLLVAAGERPRAFVRDSAAARQRLGEQVEAITGDLDRPETVDAALTGVDRVFLMTPQNTRQPQWEQTVIQAAGRAGARHIVKLSVVKADERASLQIARQHRQAEQTLEQSGLAYTILRPLFFMQNLLGMVRDGAIRTAAGDGRVGMVDVRDVAAVAVAALTDHGHEGRIYTLSGPEPLSFDDVARVLSEATGSQMRHVRVSPTAVRTALERAGVAAWFADDMSRLQQLFPAGYEDFTTDDVRSVTGSSPRTLAEFAGDFAGALTGGPQGR